MFHIIALTGTTGAGKDTLVDACMAQLEGFPHLKKVSFSDQLRDICTDIFPWLPNTTEQAVKNVPFEHPLNDHNLAPRQVWKNVALAIRGIQDNVLACRAAQQIERVLFESERNGVVFIPDLRSVPEDKILESFVPRKVKLIKIRVVDPKVTIENCEPIDEPTFGFRVDHEIINHKDIHSIVEMNDIVNSYLSK